MSPVCRFCLSSAVLALLLSSPVFSLSLLDKSSRTPAGSNAPFYPVDATASMDTMRRQAPASVSSPVGVWIEHGKRGSWRWEFFEDGTVQKEEILRAEGRAPITLRGSWTIEEARLLISIGQARYAFTVEDGGSLVGDGHRLTRDQH